MMKKRSILYSLLVTYILVLIIPVFIGGSIYLLVGNVLEIEINNANAALTKNMRDTIDSRIRDIEQLSIQIAFSDKINSAVEKDSHFTILDPFSYYKIVEEMKSFGANKYYINDYYVYLKNTDVILSQYSRFDSKECFEYYMKELGISYEEWKEILGKNHKREFATFCLNSKNGEKPGNLIYIQSLPVSGTQSSSATTVIIIDEDKLSNSLKNIAWINDGQVLILDEYDRVISSAGANNYSPVIKYRNLNGESGLIYEQISGQKMAIGFITSASTKWKYVSIVPDKSFWAKLNYVKNLIIIYLSVSVIVGGVMSYFFSKRNFNPIKAAIKELMQRSGEVYSNHGNELEFIKTIVGTTLDQKRDLLEQIQRQKNILKDNFLLRLMKGRFDSTIPLQDMVLEYDMQFYSDFFAIVLFYIEDYMELMDSGKDYDSEKQYNLIKFIIQNVMEEICNREHRGYVVEVDDRIMACIINLNVEEKDSYSQVMAMVEEVTIFFTTKCKIYSTISISDIHMCVNELSVAYREAVEAMEYKLILGKHTVIEYRHIKDRPSNYYPDIDIKQKLVNFIKVGDNTKAMETIHQLFQRSVYENTISVEMVKCLMYDLTSTLVKTIDSICEPSFIEQVNPIKRLLSCKTVLDMENELISVVEKVCEHEKIKRQCHQIGSDVMNYIDDRYNDINLSVGVLGSEFNLAPSYLSKLFREQTGLSIPDYINKVRISKAKQIMEDRTFSISDIAVKVGYGDSNALIRVFKKYEGITPGQFKSN